MANKKNRPVCPLCGSPAETELRSAGWLDCCSNKKCELSLFFMHPKTWDFIVQNCNSAHLSMIEQQFKDSIETMQKEMDAQEEIVRTFGAYVKSRDMKRGTKSGWSDLLQAVFDAYFKYQEKRNGKNTKG